MRKFLCLIVIIMCSMGFTFPKPDSSRELYKNNLGLVTEDSLNIYSGITQDKIMNSPEWFYNKKLDDPSGQEMTAQRLMQYAPFLTKQEAMKAAEQNFASMLTEKINVPELLDKAADKVKDLLESPAPEALRAYNKLAVNKAMKTGKFNPQTFAGQEANFSRLKAQAYSDRYKLYNPQGRNDIGITIDG